MLLNAVHLFLLCLYQRKPHHMSPCKYFVVILLGAEANVQHVRAVSNKQYQMLLVNLLLSAVNTSLPSHKYCTYFSSIQPSETKCCSTFCIVQGDFPSEVKYKRNLHFFSLTDSHINLYTCVHLFRFAHTQLPVCLRESSRKGGEGERGGMRIGTRLRRRRWSNCGLGKAS